MNDYRVVVDKQTGEMKKVAKDDNTQHTPPAEPTIPSLDTLLEYEHPVLAALARRLACECGQAAWMTEDEAEQALYDVLLKKGLKGDIAAVREYFDRKKGKAMQTIRDDRVDQTSVVERAKWLLANGMATAKLLDLCRQMPEIDLSQYDIGLIKHGE